MAAVTTTASIGLDGPLLATAVFSVTSKVCPMSTCVGGAGTEKDVTARSATATTLVLVVALSLSATGSGAARLSTVVRLVRVAGPPASYTRSAGT